MPRIGDSGGSGGLLGPDFTRSPILVYDAAGTERVRIGPLTDDTTNPDYGILVRDPTGLIEIIDGVSDVFTVLGSGSASVTAVATSTVSETFVDTVFNVPSGSLPMALFLLGPTAAGTDLRSSPYVTTAERWAAASSGGSPTIPFRAIETLAYGKVQMSGSSCNVYLRVENWSGANIDRYMRWYVFRQAGV